MVEQDNVDAEATPSSKRCPVEMYWAQCERLLHSAPLYDTEPVCLMHSRDPEKSDLEFQNEFAAILKTAEEKGSVAAFTKFVFPTANYHRQLFAPICDFSDATFVGDADFGSASFLQAVYMTRATFAGGADFTAATFSALVTFAFTVFARHALFTRAKFNGRSNFRKCSFTEEAGFTEASFAKEARFELASFMRKVYFESAIFAKIADFSLATFAQEANFSRVTFIAEVMFRETTFRHDDELLPGPRFSLTRFPRSGATLFYKVYLGQAIFSNCDVSKVIFSSVEWRMRPKSRKRMVFEEVVAFEAFRHVKTAAASGSDERDYQLIAELYQQLKGNYDERKDYWTAGDFHYGELEMKRLHSERRSPLLRWLRRHLGLIAWYKYASSYGESYVRPLLLLMVVLCAFTLLFPLAGLDLSEAARRAQTSVTTQQALVSAGDTQVSYRHFMEFLAMYPGRRCNAIAAFFGHSLMTALSVAGFQKELRYEPSYPWGRSLALLELLLSSTLIALFLLAVRRQFRR